MKINNFRGDPTDIPAEKEALTDTSSELRLHCSWLQSLSVFKEGWVKKWTSVLSEIICPGKRMSYNITNSGRDTHLRGREIVCLQSVYSLNPVHLNPSSLYTVGPLIMWIGLGDNTSVYRGTRGSRRSGCGPSENLKEWFSSSWWYLASLVMFVLLLSANCG